jgi:2-methylcitrate dehydratase PrpD
MTTRPTASEQIADYVQRVDAAAQTPEQIHTVARAFLDTVGAALAGQREPASQVALAYGRQQGRGAAWEGTVWATGERLPLETAGLVNGTMGHVLDYDDLMSPLRAHLSVAFLPLLVGLAEHDGSTGRELAAAYIVGFEVAHALALPMVSEHYALGWHSTLSVGGIAATAAGAHLLRFSQEQTVNALGLAVAQASGTRANFGTMAKSFQAGQVSAAAARALGLARLGFDASAAAIDGESGYLTLYARGEDVRDSLAALGSGVPSLDLHGMDVKKYPLCYATHRVLDGLLDLRAAHGLTLADVERVQVRVNRHGLKPLLHHLPQTGLEGKFSMEYAVAAVLLDGEVVLGSFTDAMVQRADAQAFFAQVTASEGDGPAMPRWAEVTLHLRDDRVLEQRIDVLRGGADAPLSDASLCAKVRDCLAYGGVSAARADALIAAAFAWADLPVRVVLRELQPLAAGVAGARV